MARKVINKMEKAGSESSLVLQQLEELRREVQLAIAMTINAPYKVLTTEEVCKAMSMSAGTLRRYEQLFNIPVRKVGNKKFYLEAEVKNCIITGLRLWKQ